MKMVGVLARRRDARYPLKPSSYRGNCTVALAVFITGFTASAGYNLHVYVRERGGAAFTGVRGRPSGPDAGFAAHVRTASTRPGLFSGGIRRPMCGACVHPPLRRQPDGLNAAWLDGDSQAAAAAGFTSGRTGNLLSLSSGFLWQRAPQPAPPPTFACALAQQLSAFPQPRLPPAAHASSAPTR